MSDILDSVGMFDLAAALPDQVAAAARLADGLEGLPSHEAVENVVILGMGGSGIGGDIAAAMVGPFCSVPIVVSKGYAAPSFIDPGTLCFAISYSGGTEETLEATQAAVEAGAHMVVLSTGGALGELAETMDFPFVRLPDIPMPRAAVGAVSVPVLSVLEQVGLYPGGRAYVDEAVTQLRRRRDELIRQDGPAQRIARQIGRTIPIAYGADAPGEVAAYRFKCQVNENAKAPAFHATVPELCHNEICGWGQHGDVTRQTMSVVRFRHDYEHPQNARRFELTFDAIDEAVHTVVDIRAAGDNALAQLFDLIIQGDFVSLHLAAEAGVDPGPIPALDDLKAALAR
ncbi:MAG TPA: bifunctional phosphoglucose/phosphomannose isomerase [Acidimicrobiales bacterium]|nr:bifunctional phosphoglucose/phosphomannose isomerase [Acidimicrobiales bacterium]